MSRSNPTAGNIPNPATRWFEWTGERGTIRYYDKTAKQNVEVGSDFTFILLDQLGSVGGWHDASQSSIYSNLVKDTRQETLVVKAHKGGTLVEGVYRDIRDRVSSLGGQFEAVCYVAFKDDLGVLALGAMKFKGAALNAWVEFSKTHRASLYTKAIRIKSYVEGKKGRIVFRVPQFGLADISGATNTEATVLDVQLQDYLKTYLARTTVDRVQPAQVQHISDEAVAHDHDYQPPSDDDIPF